MTPNSATLLLDGRDERYRDERYYETLSPMFWALARKYLPLCRFLSHLARCGGINDPGVIPQLMQRKCMEMVAAIAAP
jgi:hypothetical protein